jgi:cellulose synthase/poly-beta-1,6-N-acetylglucosamine synthase-like glycosyltransferase
LSREPSEFTTGAGDTGREDEARKASLAVRSQGGFAEPQARFRVVADLPAELRALRGYVEPVFLRWAASRAQAIGLTADMIVLRSGVIDADTFLNAVSEDLGIETDRLDDRTGIALDAADILSNGLLPARLRDGETPLTIALTGNNLRTIHDHLAESPKLAHHIRITSFERLRDFVTRSCGEQLAQEAAFGLQRRWPDFSAGLPGSSRYAIGIVAAVAAFLALLAFPAGLASSVVLLGIELCLASIFLAWSGLRLLACFHRFPPKQRLVIPDHELPVYSILVPLYREANVVADLARSISALDYPREKLDVKLILEADDAETIAAAKAILLDPCFEIFIAPKAGPRTKPKALQASLPFVRGEFVVVFDAEDRPHPGQLREAYAAFRSGDRRLACVQARLEIDNEPSNFLVKHFRAEYAGLFNVLLPALARLRLPLPLGGTSNHFRAAVLRDVGGWDPHNVTEDADLGIRLARFGYSTGVLHSTTWEEAPAGLRSWLTQRTRWFKGWLQTYVVHIRDRGRLRAQLGGRGYLAFQLLIGGTIAAPLVHPIFLFWLFKDLATGAFGFSAWPEILQRSLALSTLAIGYLSSALLAVVGSRRRKQQLTAFTVLTIPLYWILLSAAAWRALLQLIYAPYRWEKTEHGLSPRSRKHEV